MDFASSRPKILILAVIAVLSLTACEQRGPQPPEITIHAIAHGYFTLSTPADWNLQEEKLQPWQEHQASSTSLRIQDAEGRDMAVLMTGGVGPIDVQGSPEGEKYTQLERGDSALAKENHFSFDAWRDDGQTASINLNFFDHQKQDHFARQSMFLYDEKYGLFTREILGDEPLTGVPTELAGMERLKAYERTEEYIQLKAMMMSLTRSKATPQ